MGWGRGGDLVLSWGNWISWQRGLSGYAGVGENCVWHLVIVVTFMERRGAKKCEGGI